MTGKAKSLHEGNRPSHVCPPDCPNYNEGTVHCEDHIEMERSRIFGLAYFKFGSWFVGIGLIVLIGILSFITSRVDVVEGAIDKHIEGSNDKLDQIHHSVMTIEFNLRKDFNGRGEEFTELQYSKEEY